MTSFDDDAEVERERSGELSRRRCSLRDNNDTVDEVVDHYDTAMQLPVGCSSCTATQTDKLSI